MGDRGGIEPPGGTMKAYTIKEAAQYLGKHEQTLEYYAGKGLLVDDYRYGDNGDRMYYESTLDAFRHKYLTAQGMTMTEIAERYGKDQATVHHHFRKLKKAEPNGKRRGQFTFAEVDVVRVAESLDWVKLPS